MKLHPPEFPHVCSQVFWRHCGSFLGCKVSSFIPYRNIVTLFQVLLNSHLSYCLKCIFSHVGATGESIPVASRFSFASCCRKLSITGSQRSLEEYPIPRTAVQSQQTVGRTQCSWLHPPAHLSVLLHTAWNILYCLPVKLLVLLLPLMWHPADGTFLNLPLFLWSLWTMCAVRSTWLRASLWFKSLLFLPVALIVTTFPSWGEMVVLFINVTKSRIAWEMGLRTCLLGIILIILIKVGWSTHCG